MMRIVGAAQSMWRHDTAAKEDLYLIIGAGNAALDSDNPLDSDSDQNDEGSVHELSSGDDGDFLET